MMKKRYGRKPDGTIARRMCLAMRKSGLGVMDLAAKAMVSPSSVSTYVNNKALPTRRTALRLASSLGCHVDWLLGVTGTDACDSVGSTETPDVLIEMYRRLSDSSKRYLLETAVLLQVKENSLR